MMGLALLIGNKNYSSWSLRPWLVLRQSALEFEEVRVHLRAPDFEATVRPWSPAGKVPVLRHHNLHVWDSLAICEYLAETFPERRLWPRDLKERAIARSVSAEMHSGFGALRSQMPMNVRASGREVAKTPELERDIARVCQLWRECREHRGARGPFLFGEFTVADAMFAPVAFRFATYGVELGEVEQAYADVLRQLPAMRAWAEAAAAEPEIIPEYELAAERGAPRA